jgi:3-oxoacyl-[acyl-carrier-protein] synthase I
MFIAATGMACPVGLGAAEACAAKRAGISAFDDLPYHDNTGEPIVGSAVPDLDWKLRRAPRLVEMLAKALADLVEKKPDGRWEQVPLLVGLAEPGRPGGSGEELAPSVVGRMQEKLKVAFHPQLSRSFPKGHTAGFEALRAARELIANKKAPACLICGVDSLVNASTLLWLDRNYRLKTLANRDGVIPGEAAAAVLVQEVPGQSEVTQIIGMGFAQEKAHLLSEEPLLGLGLTAAVRTALTEAKLGLHEIDCRLSDVTGELYGFKELPLMTGRLMRTVRKQAQPLWHWAEAIGDPGAAAGVAQLVLADEALRKEYSPGHRFLCMTSSLGGDRAAAILRRIARSPA